MKSLVLVAMLGGTALAEPPRYSCKEVKGDATLKVELKPAINLSDFVAWYTSFTCRVVIYDAAISKSTVTIVVPKELTAKQASQLFYDSLPLFKVTATEKGDNLVLEAASAGTAYETYKPPYDYDKMVKRLDDGHCQVTRELVDKVATDSAIAREARIVPAVKDGKPVGFKLYAIRPGSLYARLGFQNGDTITAVNGMPVLSPDNALEAYAKVKASDKLTIDVLRRGKAINIEIVVTK